jgi:hypothetical protein
MLRTFSNLLIPFTLLLLFGSCQATMRGVIGLKKATKLSETEIVKTATDYKIPENSNFELDPRFHKFLQTFKDTSYQEIVKNHSQPLQALYFDKSGQLKSYHINCYTTGFPVLKWNLNTFVPATAAPIDSLFSLDTQLKFLKPLTGTNMPENIADYDYTVIVYWNKFWGRQSRRLVNEVQKNCSDTNGKKTLVLFVNNDNLSAKLWK